MNKKLQRLIISERITVGKVHRDFRRQIWTLAILTALAAIWLAWRLFA